MYRYLSSIRHARGSSIFSLLSPKPSLIPSSASSRALACRYFPGSLQNDIVSTEFVRGGLIQSFEAAEHVRGFSTRESDPSTFSTLGRDRENTGSENVDDLNLDSLSWDKENMNSRSDNVNNFNSSPDRFLRKPITENAENGMSFNRETHPLLSRFRENLNSSSENAGNGRSFNRESGTLPSFMQDRETIYPRSENAQNGRGFGREFDTRPFSMRDRENIKSRSENDAGTERSHRPMDFVRGIIDKDDDDAMGQIYSRAQFAEDADHVHIKMLRNNTFVTVTDSKGNIKLSGSAGSVKELKSGQKLSRYAAEATAEVVGRRARGLGLKAVVMKVNGFTHFRRKRQAIMSWLEGFSDSRGDKSKNPVVFIEDTTRKPHNGCRLPKKRRI